MKKGLYIFSIVLFSSVFINAQTPLADELVQIHNVENDTEMNSITPNEGALIYNKTTKRIYKYDNSKWVRIAVLPSVKEVTSNYTLLLSDDGNVISVNSSTDITLTVPSGFPIGYNVSVYQIGNGQVTITGSGATVKNRLNRFKTAGLDAAIGIIATGNNVFHVSGDLKL